MKKTFVIICILIMVLTATAYASNDFQQKWRMKLTALEPDEIEDINIVVQNLLFERKALVDGVKVSAGMYIVGTDIPSGTYRIEYRPSDEFAFCSFLATNEAEMFGYHTILGFSGASEIGKIELTDGTNIEINGGDVYFYTYTGLFH